MQLPCRFNPALVGGNASYELYASTYCACNASAKLQEPRCRCVIPIFSEMRLPRGTLRRYGQYRPATLRVAFPTSSKSGGIAATRRDACRTCTEHSQNSTVFEKRLARRPDIGWAAENNMYLKTGKKDVVVPNVFEVRWNCSNAARRVANVHRTFSKDRFREKTGATSSKSGGIVVVDKFYGQICNQRDEIYRK
ncbi:uncharacterized protein LOC143213434 [Lasioglossum baleicum]|uniref:uncharacterized protein LOC143213434 n=1 Tax=Lasioglossum baleicum TaxID=434251 RepID=UPI003FCC4507